MGQEKGTRKKNKGHENLRPIGVDVPVPPREVQQRNGSLGGKASAKVRREKADMRRALEMILGMKATGETKELLMQMGYPDDEQTNANAIAATLYSMGIQGDHKALDTLLNYVLAVKEDDRKTKESDARIMAMKANVGGDLTVTSSDDDDGDVVIYLPKLEEEDDESVQASENEEK